MPRPRTSDDGDARLSHITVNVTAAELVEIDTARGPTKRGAFVRTAALDKARAGVRSAKEGARD